MAPKTVKNQGIGFAARAAVTGFRTLRGAINLFPLQSVLNFAPKVAPLLKPVMDRELRIASAQLDLARAYLESHPAVKAAARQLRPRDDPWTLSNAELFQRMIRHFCTLGAEMFLIDKLMTLESGPDGTTEPQFRHITASSVTRVRELLNARRGVLGLSAHLGSFELISAFYAKLGASITTVGRQANYPLFDALIEELRKNYGVENIARTAHATAASVNTAFTSFRKAIRENRTIAILIDQDTSLPSDYPLFFGQAAATPKSVIELAVRHQTPIFTTFVTRMAPLHHHIWTEEIVYDVERPDCVAEILATYSSRLEVLLAAFPEQWPWWHRRWRRRPGVDYRDAAAPLPSKSQYVEWLQNTVRGARS